MLPLLPPLHPSSPLPPPRGRSPGWGRGVEDSHHLPMPTAAHLAGRSHGCLDACRRLGTPGALPQGVWARQEQGVLQWLRRDHRHSGGIQQGAAKVPGSFLAISFLLTCTVDYLSTSAREQRLKDWHQQTSLVWNDPDCLRGFHCFLREGLVQSRVARAGCGGLVLSPLTGAGGEKAASKAVSLLSSDEPRLAQVAIHTYQLSLPLKQRNPNHSSLASRVSPSFTG